MLNTPVLFIVFNRPDTTARVFESIRSAQPSKLYIASDGPRPNNREDEERCQQVRAVFERIDWPCEVKTLYNQENLGCSLGPRKAFDWFFQQEEEGIILEDDCLPNESFYRFCEELLDRYRNDTRVIAISGSNMGYQLKGENSYTYSRVLNMWGWATWRRSAEAIDYRLSDWKKVKNKIYWCYKHLRQDLFDTDINWYKYWVEKFDLTVNREKITWWDWQWIYYQVANKKLSIVPKVNLVTNIGFDESATHTKESTNRAANLPSFDLAFPLKHPAQKNIDTLYEEEFLKWILFYHRRLPWHFYVRHFSKHFIKNLFKK